MAKTWAAQMRQREQARKAKERARKAKERRKRIQRIRHPARSLLQQLGLGK